jgi:hypothetical protein
MSMGNLAPKPVTYFWFQNDGTGKTLADLNQFLTDNGGYTRNGEISHAIPYGSDGSWMWDTETRIQFSPTGKMVFRIQWDGVSAVEYYAPNGPIAIEHQWAMGEEI